MISAGVESSRCPFCAIARGEDRSVEVVCEDESWIAFFPLEPATPGHTLVIPRIHVADLWAAPAPLVSELVTGAVFVGKAINSAISPEGKNIITSAGPAGEQTVFHLHLHVVPRWPQDGFGRIWPMEGSKYESADLENVGRLIRAECQRKRAARELPY
jgi:histidine triad (HIT) family protein